MAVKAYGDRVVIEELRRLQDGVLADKIGGAVKKAAELIKDEAQKRVPVRTGALKNSIKAKMTAKLRGKVFCDYPNTGRLRKTKTKKQAAGSKEYYAFAVEYGTRHVVEQPFLKPAAEAKAMEAADLIMDAMKEAVPNDRPI
ncbi:MAG: HK97 gp10 family phage protein [Synergistaceae bacterium]|nr:HK97 gp10 family phage protein [Synergistaceae bacterium]